MLNVYDPNDIIEHIPEMATPEFMQHVQSAFKAVLAHVNRSKYNSDLGAADDDLDEQDYAEADKQRDEEQAKLKAEAMERLVHDQYIYGLS